MAYAIHRAGVASLLAIFAAFNFGCGGGGSDGAVTPPPPPPPPSATQLAFTVAAAATTAGTSFTPAVRVTARDAQGNTATGFTGNISIAIGTNPGGGTLAGTSTVAAVAGVATFGNLSIDKVGVGYTLIASASGLTSATTTAFDIQPGPASRLVFTGQPSVAVAGTPIAPAVRVTAQDAHGNTATSFASSVTLAIGTNPAGGVLSGTVTAAAVAGVASFSNLSVDKAGNGYTLTATATGLTGSASAVFNITPPLALQWVSQTSGTTNYLRTIWGSSPTDVFAVGDRGTILHYDGTSWSSMNSGTTADLQALWGFGPREVYAGGSNLTLLKYDGTSWQPMPYSHPFTRSIWAMWGSSSTNLWGVGTGYLRVHYNGTAWSGSTNIVTGWLIAAWGSSATNVWAVGDGGAVYRYNGTTWLGDLDVDNLTDLWLDLRGIWGTGPNEVFAVGDYDSNGFLDGDNSGIILRYDGTSWNPLYRDQVPDLRAIWGTSGSDFFVVGVGGTIVHYHGTSFTRHQSGTTQQLHGVWGSGNTIFAVGGGGTILTYRR